ncbi:MAG TPA: ATP-binding cassette domain-containing protein [Rhodospirillales bacterium]|nr:ATP-binding cassette domain-containing protein [Rhodospirillales bacterium]
MLKIRRLTRPGIAPLDLDLAEGECISIGGPSGAGKSLMLRSIVDLDPNEGEVSLMGRARDAVPAPDWRRRVVYVPAEAGWWADRVETHFDDPALAAPLMMRLGLAADALDWQVARLSTGEKQRLAMVRAFLTSPQVMLLDEPTSGLDPEATAKVEAMLHERRGEGVAMVLITHDADQAARMATRHFQMNAGELSLVEQGQGAGPGTKRQGAGPGTKRQGAGQGTKGQGTKTP